MANATFTARFRGADAYANRLTELTGFMTRELRDTVKNLGQRSVIVYQAHAPAKTGRLARGISSEPAMGGTEVVSVRARDPRSGYDYVGVTRFGHRKAWITPKAERAIATVASTKRARRIGPAAALRIPVAGGDAIFRHRVRGFKPAGDWATKALPQINREVDRAMAVLSSRIAVRVR